MSSSTAADTSEDVSDFLQRIKELGDKRDQEDEERNRKLEEEILQGRKERQARRAGKLFQFVPALLLPLQDTVVTTQRDLNIYLLDHRIYRARQINLSYKIISCEHPNIISSTSHATEYLFEGPDARSRNSRIGRQQRRRRSPRDGSLDPLNIAYQGEPAAIWRLSG